MLKHIVEYAHLPLSDFLDSRFVKENSFGSVYINLWADAFSLKSAFGSVYRTQCLHKVIHPDTKKCVSCQAYVGHISEELEDLDYYNNIYYIKSRLKADDIFIRTDRFYPDNYTPTLYGNALSSAIKSRAMYSKTYIISERKARPFSHRKLKNRKKNETYFLIHFTTKKRNLFKDNHFVASSIKPQSILKQVDKNKRSLVINPYYNEVVIAENMINVICNSKILKYIENKRG